MKESFVLTPLGAAIVEAMPDDKERRRIQRNFKRNAVCPTSAIFPTVQSVEQFYSDRNKSVKGAAGK